MPTNTNNTPASGKIQASPAERFRRNLTLNNPSSNDVINQQNPNVGTGNTLMTKNYNTVDKNIGSPYHKLINNQQVKLGN